MAPALVAEAVPAAVIGASHLVTALADPAVETLAAQRGRALAVARAAARACAHRAVVGAPAVHALAAAVHARAVGGAVVGA